MSLKRMKRGRALPVLLAVLAVLCLMTASVVAAEPLNSQETFAINPVGSDGGPAPADTGKLYALGAPLLGVPALPDWLTAAGLTADDVTYEYDDYFELYRLVFLRDVRLTDSIVFPNVSGGLDVEIDLNGKNVKAAPGKPAMKAAENSTVYLFFNCNNEVGELWGGKGVGSVCKGCPAIDFSDAYDGGIDVSYRTIIVGGSSLGYQQGVPGILVDNTIMVSVDNDGIVKGGGAATYNLVGYGVQPTTNVEIGEYGHVFYGDEIVPLSDPVITDRTAFTVTVEEQEYEGETVEYAVSLSANGSGLSRWRQSLTIGDLSPETTYYVYARIAERTSGSNRHDASAYSGPIPVKTKAAPAPPPNYKVDYINERTDATAAGYEYSTDDGTTWTAVVGNGYVPLLPDSKYLIRKAGNDDRMPGESQTLRTPERLYPPQAMLLMIDYVSEDMAYNSSGVELEYSSDNGATWKTGMNRGTTIPLSDLTGMTIQVRFPAEEGQYYHSEAVDKAIPARPAPPTVLPAVQSKTDTTVKIEGLADKQSYNVREDRGSTYLYEWYTYSESTPLPDDTIELPYLTQNTEYAICTRFAAVRNVSFASDVKTVKVKTMQSPAAAPNYTINYSAETTVEDVPATMEYSTDYRSTWTDAEGGKLPLAPGTVYFIREKGTAEKLTGNYQELEVPERPDFDWITVNYGTELTDTAVGQEYSLDGGATWTDCTANMSASAWAGKTVTVRIKATDSAYSSEAQSLTVASRPLTPAAPVLSNKTDTQIILKECVKEQEYSIDGGSTWTVLGDGVYVYDGLSADTEYSIVTRVPAVTKGLNKRFASAVSEPLTVTTKQSAPAAPSFAIDFDNETTTAAVTAEYEYSADRGKTWIPGSGSKLALEEDTVYFFRAAGTDSRMTGPSQTLIVPARPGAPVCAVDYAAETADTSEALEYSLDGGAAWTGCTADMSASAWAGKTVCIRIKATDEAYASPAQTLTVAARPATPAAPVLKSKTDTTLSVQDCVREQEYSIDGGATWEVLGGSIYTYEGLNPAADYEIVTRVKAVTEGDALCFASAVSDALAVTTKAAPADAPEITPVITDTSIALPVSGEPNAYEYSTDGKHWNDVREFADLDPATEYVYYVRVAETETAMPSKAAAVDVYTNYAAPDEGEGYSMDEYSIFRETKGYPILRFENGYEVSTTETFDMGTAIVDGTTLTPGQTYYLRVAATAEPPVGASTAISFVPQRQPQAEVNIDFDGMGCVTVDGAVDGVYYVGDTLTATAEADTEYRFTGWYNGDDKICSDTVMKVTAEKVNNFFAKFVFIGSYKECSKGEACPLDSFADASEKAWYHDGVHYCVENGLMNGIGGGSFDPNGDISRAMIVTMLYRLEGSPAVSGEYPFKDDVNVQNWYKDAVIWAAQNGVVNGISKTQFAPDNIIDREQLACMIYRYAELKHLVTGDSSGEGLDYPDKEKVSEWAWKAMRWCVEEGLIQGMNGQLNPKATASRAQAATVFVRFTENILLKA